MSRVAYFLSVFIECNIITDNWAFMLKMKIFYKLYRHHLFI